MSRKPIPSSKKYFFGLFLNNSIFQCCESTCFDDMNVIRDMILKFNDSTTK